MADDKLKELCAMCRRKLGMCTHRMSQLNESLKDGNTEAVNTSFEHLNMALNGFEDACQSVQVLLEEDEMKIDNDWYQPKMHL